MAIKIPQRFPYKLNMNDIIALILVKYFIDYFLSKFTINDLKLDMGLLKAIIIFLERF